MPTPPNVAHFVNAAAEFVAEGNNVFISLPKIDYSFVTTKENARQGALRLLNVCNEGEVETVIRTMAKPASYTHARFVNAIAFVEIIDGIVYITVDKDGGKHTSAIPIGLYKEYFRHVGRLLDEWDAEQEGKVVELGH